MDQKTNMWIPGMLPGTNNCTDLDLTKDEIDRLLDALQRETNNSGPNKHVLGTGSSDAMNHGRKNIGEKRQYQSSTMEDALTARMANSHNWQPYMNPHQQAGNSQPSNEGNKSDPKKLAKQLSDVKYREKKKQKMTDLERNVDGLTGRNELLTGRNKFLEDQNASLKKDKDRLEKNLKQTQKKASQLQGTLSGQNAGMEVIYEAFAKSNNVDVLRENEQLKYEKALLMNQINNPHIVDIIQLQAKNAQLESEVSLYRRLVIDALCKTMKTDVKDDEQELSG